MTEAREAIARMNLYQKLSAIEQEAETVAKNFTVGTGKYSYKAVSEADVKRVLRPLEAKYGVKSFPVSSEEVANEIVMNGERANFYLRLKLIYRFVNIDNPSEYIDVPCYGDGLDAGDKATGKAQTYAQKYALMLMYHLVTGEDPDKEASKEYSNNCTQEQIEKLQILYNPDELSDMLGRLKKNSLMALTAQQAEKMIDFRETVARKVESF